jgi:hypothetical protein
MLQGELSGELVQREVRSLRGGGPGQVRLDPLRPKSRSPRRLVDDAIQPKAAMPLRDAGVQTRALVKGVAEIAAKLNAAGFHYKAHNRSPRRLDHGWYPPSIANKSESPEQAMRKLTRPYQWLRREAISNLRVMQALISRPRMPRRVLTPGQGAEAAPGGFGCKEIGPAGRLARY